MNKMSELNEVKDLKRKKMKLRRTQDLISQEILTEERVPSARKPIKKLRRKRNDTFLPKVDDLFKSSCLKVGELSTATSSTVESDFKKPVVNKRITKGKSASKVKCIGGSWLVEPITDVSSSADSTKESLEDESWQSPFTKKDSDSIGKKKSKSRALKDMQMKPCFVLLDKLIHDFNDKVQDGNLKFLPSSSSSSPELHQWGSDLRDKERKSSLTKEMFEELPNWSYSDYWNVEDILVDTTKPKDGSKSVSNVKNSRCESNRPSINSTINVPTSTKTLKNISTFEVEKLVDISQRQLQRKDSILSQSITATTKPTTEVDDIVNKTTAEDESKSVSNVNNSTYELNLPWMNNSTVNLSTSKVSLKNNSTFEIEQSLDISQTQPKRRSRSLILTTNPTASKKRKTLEVDDIVNKTAAEDESKSVSNVNNSTYELNLPWMNNSTVNLSTSKMSLKNNSTFEIEKSLDISQTQPKRRSRSLISTTKPTPSKKRTTLETAEVINKTTGEDESQSILSPSLISTTKPSGSFILNEKNYFENSDKSPSKLLSSDEKNDAGFLASPFVGGNSLTDSEKSKGIKHQSTSSLNDSVSTTEVLKSGTPGRKKWVILDQSKRLGSFSRQSFSESSANMFIKPLTKRRTIGEFSATFERRKSSLFDAGIKESPARTRKSGLERSLLAETSLGRDGDNNIFIFGRKSSEAPETLEKYSDPEENESPVFSELSQPGVTIRRRATLTLDDTVTDIEVLKSACDSLGSPKQLEPFEERRRSRRSEIAIKKRRCVTFDEASVIIIDDSETSFEGTPIHNKRKPNDSFTVTSTTSPRSVTPRESRHRISSDSFLYKQSIGLNHNIYPSIDDLAIENKIVAPPSKSKLKKMPNFAKIHQKMFDKMLNLREYSEKKNERAKLLLSGTKPPVQPKKGIPVIIKKQLFSATASTSTKSNLITSTPKVNKRMVGIERFGFQAAQRNAAKQEEIKAVANKMRPIKIPKQRFREELKGVRSNKRFDLLMKMRTAKGSS